MIDTTSQSQQTAHEAKALVALSFRNGPIEDLHAGRTCPRCAGQLGYSRISDAEMKAVMKSAVDQLYRLLCLKTEDPRMYESEIRRGTAYTTAWDEPAGASSGPLMPTTHELRSQIPDGGVVLTIPLSSPKSGRDDEQSDLATRRRNRLKEVVSYIAFTIRNRGFASAYECSVCNNSLNLVVAGSDTDTITAELQTYLSLFRVADHAKMIVFRDGSSELVEMKSAF